MTRASPHVAPAPRNPKRRLLAPLPNTSARRAHTADNATRFTTVSHRKKAARTSTCMGAQLIRHAREIVQMHCAKLGPSLAAPAGAVMQVMKGLHLSSVTKSVPGTGTRCRQRIPVYGSMPETQLSYGHCPQTAKLARPADLQRPFCRQGSFQPPSHPPCWQSMSPVSLPGQNPLGRV